MTTRIHERSEATSTHIADGRQAQTEKVVLYLSTTLVLAEVAMQGGCFTNEHVAAGRFRIAGRHLRGVVLTRAPCLRPAHDAWLRVALELPNEELARRGEADAGWVVLPPAVLNRALRRMWLFDRSDLPGESSRN